MDFIDENGNRKLINDRFDYHGVEFVTVKDERNMLTVYEPAYGVEVKTGKYDQLFSLNRKFNEIADDIDRCSIYKESCEFEKNWLGEIAMDVIKNDKRVKNKRFNQKFVEKLENLRKQVLEKSKKGIAIGIAFAACCCFAPRLSADAVKVSLTHENYYSYENPAERFIKMADKIIDVEQLQHDLNVMSKEYIKATNPKMKETSKNYEELLKNTIVRFCAEKEVYKLYGNNGLSVDDSRNDSYSAMYFKDSNKFMTADCFEYLSKVKYKEIEPVLEVNGTKQEHKKVKTVESVRGL